MRRFEEVPLRQKKRSIVPKEPRRHSISCRLCGASRCSWTARRPKLVVGLKLPGKEMILCWFHLAKRVYQRLSAAGFAKARRQAIEQEVLRHLWQGDLAGAVWVLWGVREEAREPKWIDELIRYLLPCYSFLT